MRFEKFLSETCKHTKITNCIHKQKNYAKWWKLVKETNENNPLNQKGRKIARCIFFIYGDFINPLNF